MPMVKLAHFSIRTSDLAASERFYTNILGFRAGTRPAFDFPGRWLYMGNDESEFGVVHLVGIDPDNPEGLSSYLGDKANAGTGTGVVDHIAFLATGWRELRERCKTEGQIYVERIVPSLGLLQVFLDDPSGVTIELNYPAEEAGS